MEQLEQYLALSRGTGDRQHLALPEDRLSQSASIGQLPRHLGDCSPGLVTLSVNVRVAGPEVRLVLLSNLFFVAVIGQDVVHLAAIVAVFTQGAARQRLRIRTAAFALFT